MSVASLKSKSAVIMKRLCERKISVVRAAVESGISPGGIIKLLRRDCLVQYRTACRLRKYFGEEAVEVVVPAQKEDTNV